MTLEGSACGCNTYICADCRSMPHWRHTRLPIAVKLAELNRCHHQHVPQHSTAQRVIQQPKHHSAEQSMLQAYPLPHPATLLLTCAGLQLCVVAADLTLVCVCVTRTN